MKVIKKFINLIIHYWKEWKWMRIHLKSYEVGDKIPEGYQYSDLSPREVLLKYYDKNILERRTLDF